MYRLFVDEVGHDNLSSANDPNERYLFLMGVCLDLDFANGLFTQELNKLKIRTFGTADVVLHRREIIDKNRPPFTVLKDDDVRRTFDLDLMGWFTESRYMALGVIIDKKEHVEKYHVWRFHPYHYCLTAMLERYVRWLQSQSDNAKGDVMVEWRGKKPNRKLENTYAHLYKLGTENVSAEMFQAALSSNSLKLRMKSANVAGLQLADLLANPVCRALICRKEKAHMIAPFGREVVKMLCKTKFRRGGFFQKIMGYGVKYLP